MAKIRQKLAKVYIHSQDNGNEVRSMMQGGGRKTMIKNNRTAMNAYKKTREKHGGDHPRCVVCGEVMDPEDDETEWSRTKRRTDCFVHRHCVKHWGDV